MDATRILDMMKTDFFGAEAEVDKILNSQPSSVPVLQLKAYLVNFRKDYITAARYLEQALNLSPNDPQSRFNLAYCHLQAGNVLRAAEEFRVIDNEDAKLLSALCCRWLGQPFTLPAGSSVALRYFLGQAIQPHEAPGLVSWLNRYDVPGWGELDDKADLARLLDQNSYSWAPQADTDNQKSGPWIAKHSKLYGGQAIHISEKIEALPQGEEWVIQRYIVNPMLLSGRKFHIRLYLACFEGRANLFDDGIVRIAPGDYSSDFHDDRRHITNTLRFSADEQTRDATRIMTLKELALAPAILDRLRQLAADLTDIVFKARVPLRHLKCSLADIPPKLLGLDVLIDADHRPWLLEVERYPALHGGSPKAYAVNARLFSSFLKILRR